MTITFVVLAGIAGWAGWIFRGASVNQARDVAGRTDDRSVQRRGYAEIDKARSTFLFIACGAFLIAAIYFSFQ